MSEFDIHVNPHPGTLPPPWYRPPPDVMKGPTRSADSIVFGLLIDNEAAREWFKNAYKYELRSDHSEDLSITIQLKKLVIEKGIAFGCCAAPRRLESLVSDFLVITQIEHGPFIHDGPETYEEVLEEHRRPIPGAKEEGVKARLHKELGKQTGPVTSLAPIGLFILFRNQHLWLQELLH